MSVEKLPDLNALVGLAALKEAVEYWDQNRFNSDEEFWQQALSDRVFVLSQLFAFTTVVIREKVYVGSKQVTNRGGNVVDFLSRLKTTDSTALIEIKTPRTKLLASEYRGVFPFSSELSGAVTQVLNYRQSLISEFHAITAEESTRLTLAEPRCLVIAGDSTELNTNAKKERFDLQRDRIQGVTVVTYDEMFEKLKTLMEVLQGTP